MYLALMNAIKLRNHYSNFYLGSTNLKITVITQSFKRTSCVRFTVFRFYGTLFESVSFFVAF